MLSSIVWISAAGMTVRIESSICANLRSVSSMRVPGTPRTCSLMRPASTLGKKSRPDEREGGPCDAATKATKPETTSARRSSAQASQLP